MKSQLLANCQKINGLRSASRSLGTGLRTINFRLSRSHGANPTSGRRPDFRTQLSKVDVEAHEFIEEMSVYRLAAALLGAPSTFVLIHSSIAGSVLALSFALNRIRFAESSNSRTATGAR